MCKRLLTILFLAVCFHSYCTEKPKENKPKLNKYIFKILVRGDDGKEYTGTGFKLKSSKGIIAPLHLFFENIKYPGENLEKYKVVGIISLLTGDTIWDNKKKKFQLIKVNVTKVDIQKDVCFIDYSFNHNLFDNLYANEGFEVDSMATTDGSVTRNAVVAYNAIVDIGAVSDFILNAYIPFSRIATKFTDIAKTEIPALDQHGFYISVHDLYEGNSGAPVLPINNPSKVIGMFGYASDHQGLHYGVVLKDLKLQTPTPKNIEFLTEAFCKSRGTTYKSGSYRECSDILYDGEDTKKLSPEAYWNNILNINCYFLLRMRVDSNLLKTKYYNQFWNYYRYYFDLPGSHTNAQTRVNQSQFDYPLFYGLLNLHCAGYKYYSINSIPNRQKLLEEINHLDSLITWEAISINELRMYGDKELLRADMRDVIYYYKERLNRENANENPFNYLPTFSDRMYYLDHSSFENPNEKLENKVSIDSARNAAQDSFVQHANESLDYLAQDSFVSSIHKAMDAILDNPLHDYGYFLLDSLKKRRPVDDFEYVFEQFPLLQNAVFAAYISKTLLLKAPLPKIEFVSQPNPRINNDALLIPVGKLNNDYLNIAYAPYPLSAYDPPQAYVIRDMILKYTESASRVLKGLASEVSFAIISEGHADGVPYNKPLFYNGVDFNNRNLDKERFVNIETNQELAFSDVKNGTSKQKNLALAFLRALFPITKVSQQIPARVTKEIFVEAHNAPGANYRYLLISIKCNYIRR